MADLVVVIGNGPCKGQTQRNVLTDTVPETFTCGGATYFTTEIMENSYLALLVGSPKPAPYAPPVDPTPEPVKLDGGLADAWGDLRRTLGHRIPGAVNETTRLRSRIRAAGRR